MKTRILIVGCGFPQLGLVRRARALGLHVMGADLNPRAVAVRHCDEFFATSTVDVPGLKELVRSSQATAIATTGSERALTATAEVAAELKLPFYANPETVRRCQEKDAMRAGYAAAGVKVPAFAACETLAEAQAFASREGSPLVVKPSRGWGQRGVARVDTPQELEQAFHEAHILSDAVGLGRVVVERWLEGREYSVNGWIERGELVSYCVTERQTVPGKKPLGVMVAEVFPSGLSRADEGAVVEEARRGARALGHTRGPCYSQVVWDPQRGAHLFETAARCGGGFDAEVTRLASGVDLYTRVLGVATARLDWEEARAEAPAHGGALVRFLIGRPGFVTRVNGAEAARAEAGIVDAGIFAEVGDRIHPLTDGAKRAGFVLGHGETRAEAETRVARALAQLELVTENG